MPDAPCSGRATGQRFDRPVEHAGRRVHLAVGRHDTLPCGYRGRDSDGRRKAGRYSAFGPVSGWSGFFDASLPAGIEVEPLASVRGCPPVGTSVPSWLHRVWK